jgi:hypothetical protein
MIILLITTKNEPTTAQHSTALITFEVGNKKGK